MNQSVDDYTLEHSKIIEYEKASPNILGFFREYFPDLCITYFSVGMWLTFCAYHYCLGTNYEMRQLIKQDWISKAWDSNVIQGHMVNILWI